MPMYYPDLNSVKKFAESMKKQRDESKRYTGIVPETEAQLPEARTALASYMRDIWGDEVGAMEVELALTVDNYYDKMQDAIKLKMFR